jgi:hypothetical protein
LLNVQKVIVAKRFAQVRQGIREPRGVQQSLPGGRVRIRSYRPSKSNPAAIKYVFRIVLNFGSRQVTKFVEASTGSTVGYHLEDQ